jgi:hypothetical protein
MAYKLTPILGAFSQAVVMALAAMSVKPIYSEKIMDSAV